MKYIAFANDKMNFMPMQDALIKAAEKMGVKVIYFDEFKDLMSKDLVIVFHNRPLEIPFTTAKVGWWMCDYRSIGDVQKAKGRVHTVFLCNKEFIQGYQDYFGCPVYYMPQHGLEPNNYRGRKIVGDAVFIGSLESKFHRERADILSKLWDSKFDITLITGHRFTKDTAWMYSQVPYSLSISPQGRGYTSNRFYNILSSGGFCLSLWFPEIEMLFQNHKEVVWFNTPEEAVEIMEYYYENPMEYYEIKKRGKASYQQKHTAFHRIVNMFDILEGKTEDFYGYIKDDTGLVGA